jgi:3-oxoacyl-[acyl-carrier protein] reductase
MMAGLMEGKNVIITGTRRGMGRAMLEVFAANGASVWAHARELTPEFSNDCEAIAKKYDVEIRPLCFELTDYDAMKAAIKEIMSTKIPVDALVNNAGITYNALFQMTNISEVRNQMEVNFFSPYIFTQYIVKLMIRNKKGSIVNIASSAGLDGNSGKSAYGSSKAALILMTKSIAEELGKSGIRSNCIAPGITNTEMLKTMPDYVVQEQMEAVDLRRTGEPEDIANTALFLASDLSSYMTGQVIRVDGGM